MPVDRFFADAGLKSGASLVIEGPEHHHLAHVMRISEKEKVEIVNGLGDLALGEVIKLDKKSAEILILSTLHQNEQSNSVILAVPLMRPSKLEWIVEKGTELGVNAFYFYLAELSKKEALSPRHLERLRILAIAALKQSGRLYLPSITMLQYLESLFTKAATYLFGDIRAKSPIDPTRFKTTPTVFITGPEQGFSPTEFDLLDRQAQGVSLSCYILRAETAPIAAASILGTRWSL